MSKLILQATGVDQTRMSTKPSNADAIDCCVGLAILMNTLILGIAADISWGGWPYVFLIFTMIYLAEVIIKVYILGPSAYFCGADALWNYTDLLFTGLAIGDSMIVLFQEGDGNSIKGLVLLRLVRLTRLTRLIKLLRLRMFKELQLMLRGILVGMSTLGWSLGLFLFLVYILALMIRFLLGPTQGELPSDSPQCNPADEWCLRSQEMIDLHYEELFSDTPRCVLTILRCFTDGCASVDGTPLIPTLFNIYGYPLLITYVFCMFFMTFGLFNLIIAIMVESTIETAKSQRFRGIDYYREEQLAIAQKMKKILQRTSDFCHDPEPVAGKTSWESRLPDIWIFNLFRVKDNLKQILSDMNSLLITPKVFKKLIWDPEISEVLDDLEISSANREGFFDVIDADGSGSISAEELITGLLRLRGSVAEKSDAVVILLGLRVIQRDLKNNVKPMIHAIANLGQRTCDRVSHIENRMQGSP